MTLFTASAYKAEDELRHAATLLLGRGVQTHVLVDVLVRLAIELGTVRFGREGMCERLREAADRTAVQAGA